MLQKLTSLSKQSAVYGLGAFLNQGIAFFLIPVYTRFLTTDEYGINGSVSAVIGVLAIVLTLSLETAIARFYYDFETEKERRAYFGAVWIFLALFGLALTLLLDLFGNRIFALILPDVPFRPYGRLALWSSFLGLAAVIPMVIFRVREQSRIFITFTVSQFLFRIVLNIVFVVYLHQGVLGIFISMLIANLVYAIPYTWISWKNLSFSFNLRQLRASLAYSLPFVPHRLSNWVLNVSDRLLLANFVTLSALGLYSLGYRFGLMVAAVLDAVNLAWAPFYFKTAKEQGGREALARLATYYVFGLMFLILATVLLSREVLFLVAAPQFHPAYKIVPIVAYAYGFHGLYLLMISGPSYAKKTARIPVYTGLAAAVNVGLNLLLIPRFGIIAAAFSTLVAFFVRTVLISIDSVRVFPLPYEYKRLAYSIGIALVLSAGWFIDVGNLWANLAIKTALLCAYPLAIRYSGLLHPSETEGLKLVSHRLQSRFIRAMGGSHD